jgi:arylsulfatase A-like enzyme
MAPGAFVKERMSPLSVTLLAGALLILSIGTLGCGGRDRGPRNLVLITVDTLRPDRLGFSGHERGTSTAIDRLAAAGVRFERSYSQSGWTLPSVATILTGRYPKDHGATRFNRALDPDLETMATILADHGYDTRGFVSHVLLGSDYGLSRGFSVYDDSVLEVGNPHKVASAVPLTDSVLRSLETLEEPFFLWVHYFDPHFKYLAHARWGHLGTAKIDRYDAEIAHTDEQIGRLLTGLEDRELLADTVVVFTADHGEEFGEHGGHFHYTLHDEVVRVPLVIRAPSLEPAVRSEISEQIDLLPTILALLGIEPQESYPGRNLLARGGEPSPVFLERERPAGFVQRAVVLDRYKLIFVEASDGGRQSKVAASTPVGKRKRRRPRVEPGIALYDLSEDPAETTNLFEESAPEASQLLDLLEKHFLARASSGEEVTLDEDLKRKLESLGYLR